MIARSLLLSALLLTAATASRAADESTTGPAGAQAFLEQVYQTVEQIPPLGEPAIYDLSLRRLLDEDARLNEGFLGALEANPLCDCQDTENFHAVVKVARWKTTTAIAHVQIENFGRREELTINLVFEQGHWRIDDIIPPRGPTMRKALEKSNNRIHHERRLKD